MNISTDILRSSDRSAQIHQALHRAIVEQRLPPGTKLSEDQLGALFGASRTLVRAALQALSRNGLVVSERHRSAYVASPTVRDAREIFGARRMVEAITAERAAARTNGQDLDDLARLLDEGSDALVDGDRGRAIRLSGEFHLCIARIADQSLLHGFLTDLLSRSSLVIALYGHSTHSSCGSSDHRDLLSCLEVRDGPGARDLMLAHLQHIEDDLDFARQDDPIVALADVFGSGPAASHPSGRPSR